MAHPLDRPVWQALTTAQAHLAEGDAAALRFRPDHSPFAAAADTSRDSLAALTALIRADGALWLLEAGEPAIPAGTIVMRSAPGVQMIASRIAAAPSAARSTGVIGPLDEADAPEMRALATLTEPGPFLACTHRLGAFVGIRHEGRLVAMAGERMCLDGHREASGVCTHPDHRGRGHAAALMRTVAQRMIERSETPFLHAYASNTGAIALYRTLGFSIRSRMTATVLARA